MTNRAISFFFGKKVRAKLDFRGQEDYNDIETILRRGWRPERVCNDPDERKTGGRSLAVFPAS